MDLQLVSRQLQDSYREQSEQYRLDDEVEVQTPHHARVREILQRLSSSFSFPIDVLDLGCGTGRFFYCLNNVRRLVGVDLSPEMLQAAEHPVHEAQISADEIQLICANAFEVNFAENSFDLAYSVGMFGFGSPVTIEICSKVHRWLRSGGLFFFDTIDSAGVHWTIRFRRGVRRLVARALPFRASRRLANTRLGAPMCDVSARQLDVIMRKTPFKKVSIGCSRDRSAFWETRKLECLAAKPHRSSS